LLINPSGKSGIADKEETAMKYDKAKYIDSGFYGIDEDIENRKEKIVKCRKPHKCASCEKDIAIGQQALYESGFMDGEPVSCYTCLECIEEWLEESGQVETEEEKID
jgi:hypothetical protein